MRKNMKMKLIIIVSIVMLLLIGVTVYAILNTTSTRGELKVSSTSVDIETAYTEASENFDWTYTKAGDTKDISVKVTNKAEMSIHRYYKVELNTALEDGNKLESAILVYYNDEFVASLAELTGNLSDDDIDSPYALLASGSNATDKISFELHQSAEESYFDGKSISIKLTTYQRILIMVSTF